MQIAGEIIFHKVLGNEKDLSPRGKGKGKVSLALFQREVVSSHWALDVRMSFRNSASGLFRVGEGSTLVI